MPNQSIVLNKADSASFAQGLIEGVDPTIALAVPPGSVESYDSLDTYKARASILDTATGMQATIDEIKELYTTKVEAEQMAKEQALIFG